MEPIHVLSRVASLDMRHGGREGDAFRVRVGRSGCASYPANSSPSAPSVGLDRYSSFAGVTWLTAGLKRLRHLSGSAQGTALARG